MKSPVTHITRTESLATRLLVNHRLGEDDAAFVSWLLHMHARHGREPTAAEMERLEALVERRRERLAA